MFQPCGFLKEKKSQLSEFYVDIQGACLNKNWAVVGLYANENELKQDRNLGF
jgi:hypothetical protein